ncbi:MAG: phage major capsid protein [Acidobacteria bacterium]|nr:phage major capsid protein [Acidobacteriota bacterium]
MSTTTTENRGGARAPLVELNEAERRRYSFRRALAVAAGLEARQSFESEVSEEIARQLPSSYQKRGGVFIPTVMSRAALDAHTPGRGAELVSEVAGPFITALRKRALVLSLGARLLTGLAGNLALPRQDTSGGAQWAADNPVADYAQTNLTLSQVPLKPRLLVSSTTFTRQLLVQSTPSVDEVVAEDMAQASAVALDQAAVHGSGAGSEPLGLYNVSSGVAEVNFAGPPTLPKVVEMERRVAAADGETDPAAAGYLTTPEVRERAKLTEEFSGTGIRLWRDGRMNDRRAEATNQLAKNLGAGHDEHACVYGIWSELVVGEWGAIEVLANPYTLAAKGLVQVTGFYLADLAPRHPESFCKSKGLVP